jgi:pantothenate kinase
MDEGQVEALLEAVDRSSGRFLLGVTGPPGAGKSTIAALIEAAANDQRRGDFAVVAPMDGFHLSNEELAERGLLGVKGAPETFDVNGFVQAVERMRADPATTIPWPGFDRSIEQTVPGAIAIRPSAKLVVVEGNYLLLERPGWRDLRRFFDEIWYVDAPLPVLRTRLLKRARASGRSEAEATAHVDGSDLRNARLVATTKKTADRQLAGAAPTEA